jgi:hypothetical protein
MFDTPGSLFARSLLPPPLNASAQVAAQGAEQKAENPGDDDEQDRGVWKIRLRFSAVSLMGDYDTGAKDHAGQESAAGPGPGAVMVETSSDTAEKREDRQGDVNAFRGTENDPNAHPEDRRHDHREANA